MIDIFKSPNSDKLMIAIYPDEDLSVSKAGEVGLLVGPEAAIQKLHEAILEATSRFPKDMQLPEGCKRPKPNGMLKAGPAAHKEEIMALYDSGLMPKEIAARLGLKFNSVRDLVYRERKKAKGNPFTVIEALNDKIAGLCQGQAESPALEPTCLICGKPSKDFDQACSKECAAKFAEKARLTTRQDHIDNIILLGVKKGHKYTQIAAKINNCVGGQWMPNDVSKRLKELRGDKP